VSSTLVRPTRRTLERGWWNPRIGYSRLSHARTGRRRDVEPVRRVSSVAIGPVQPSPTPRHHPGHCSTIPGVVGVQDDKTSPRPLLCDRRPSVSSTLELTHERRQRRRSHTTTLITAPGRIQDLQRRSARSKIRQDDRHLCGTVHHTTTCS
jgi:hypothetical protein